MDANGTLMAADKPDPGFHERSISADQRFPSFVRLDELPQREGTADGR